MSRSAANRPDPGYRSAALPVRAALRLPQYRVVLLGEGVQELMFVVRTIMELTRLCREEATHKMWQAHHSGRSVVLTTHRERAELYAELFADRGLMMALEAV